MKVFNLYWKGGNIEPVEGDTFEEAFRNAGYGAGALRSLDYYEEAKELDMIHKKIVFLEDKKQSNLGNAYTDTMFIRQLIEQVGNGVSQVSIAIAGHEWVCDIKITAFEIQCICILHKQNDNVLYQKS